MIPENSRQIRAFFGLMVAAVLLAVFCLSSGAIPIMERNPQIFRQARAWWLGARFITTDGIVLQTHHNDCGPAALKMVLAAHGIERSLSDLTADLQLTARGTSMRQLRLVSVKLGLPAKSWLIHPRDLRQVPLPAIAFISKGHFVVIRRFIASEVLEVDDPALGKLQWPARSFQKIWSGETLVFDPVWAPLQPFRRRLVQPLVFDGIVAL